MLAIIEHWETANCHHTDNTGRYLQLIAFKMGLDVLVLYLCWRKLHTSILSMCSLSIVMADLVMVWFLTTLWIVGSMNSLASLCVFLAHCSAIFASLPLPMAVLGLLDYILLESRCYHGKDNVTFKILRNASLTALMWVLSIAHSLGSVTGNLREIEYQGGAAALVCEVQESSFIFCFTIVLLIAVLSVLLPHCTKIPQWYREAERLSDQRDEPPQKPESDFRHTVITNADAKSREGHPLAESVQEWPSLRTSLTLGFALIWTPYLLISVVCQLLGLAVPAYIAVNLLWLECSNSVLAGLMFWARNDRSGPYTQLPDNVCLWSVYWHLSRRTYPYQQKFPTAVIY